MTRKERRLARASQFERLIRTPDGVVSTDAIASGARVRKSQNNARLAAAKVQVAPAAFATAGAVVAEVVKADAVPMVMVTTDRGWLFPEPKGS